MNRSGWQRLLLVLFLGVKTNRFAAIFAPNTTEPSKNLPALHALFTVVPIRN
jgi:hypothetical protein